MPGALQQPVCALSVAPGNPSHYLLQDPDESGLGRPGVRGVRQAPLPRRRHLRRAHRVPFFMDGHEFVGLSAEEAALAHLKDLKIQGRYGVRFLTYWFDEERQTAFCLAKAPSADAVEEVHRASHGYMAYQIIEVDEPMVARFMGGILEHPPGEVYVEAAFRTILFTDIVESTSMTQRLGDAGAMAMVRAHDEIVRGTLEHHRGSEVKHTGDGLMAAFPSVVSAIESAVEIQRRIADAQGTGRMPVRVRIGMAAGEPVTERNDLFGATVQLAARLCSRADPGGILVASAVHDLALGKGFAFRSRGRLRLKGFDSPMPAFEVVWRTSGS
jgi:class 3 adenylate cyclase